MLDRISVNILLKSVIGMTAGATVILLGLSARDSAQRLAATARIDSVMSVSAEVFTAINTLRTDRATTTTDLDIEAEPYDASKRKHLKVLRDAEMAALHGAAERLASIDIVERDQLLPLLHRSIATVTELQQRSTEALAKPKSERPSGLGTAYSGEISTLLDTLDKLSERLAATIKDTDPVVARMMAMKRIAWKVRNASGDAALALLGALRSGHLTPEVTTQLARFVAASEALWGAFKDAARGADVSQALQQSIEEADRNYFAGEYPAVRDRLVQALVAGQPPEMDAPRWAAYHLEHLAYLLNAAAAAIDGATVRAAALRSNAERDLVVQLALLAAAIGLAAGSMLTVGRRVIAPLQAIRTAMLKVAAGDVAAEALRSKRRDEIGALWGALASFRQNAVEKARIEREQRRLEEQLHHAQRLESLGTLAGGIAHELNNTLVPVVALTKLVSRRLPDGSRERTNLETVAQASERARDLVKQILAFSRKHDLRREVFDVAAVAVDALSLLRASIPSNIRLEHVITPRLPLQGDPGQLHQLIVNLVTNAAQAIAEAQGTVTLVLGEDDDRTHMRLSVSDTGCGMDKETRARMFEPFFTTKAVGQGTGLGLAVVHGIVTSHGGRINVESAPGNGTRLEVVFPIYREESVPPLERVEAQEG
jgi:signal transduction histidine kinase